MSDSSMFTTEQMMAAWSMASEADERARRMGEFLYEKPWNQIDELKRRELLYSAMANLGFAIHSMTIGTLTPPSDIGR